MSEMVLVSRADIERWADRIDTATDWSNDGQSYSVCVEMRAALAASPSASADRGGLREKVARVICDKARLDLTAGFPPFGRVDNPNELADAILALVSPALQQKGEET